MGNCGYGVGLQSNPADGSTVLLHTNCARHALDHYVENIMRSVSRIDFYTVEAKVITKRLQFTIMRKINNPCRQINTYACDILALRSSDLSFLSPRNCVEVNNHQRRLSCCTLRPLTFHLKVSSAHQDAREALDKELR